jgi:hypothetical protein
MMVVAAISWGQIGILAEDLRGCTEESHQGVSNCERQGRFFGGLGHAIHRSGRLARRISYRWSEAKPLSKLHFPAPCDNDSFDGQKLTRSRTVITSKRYG